jgi:hypothetical protein
MTSRSPNEARPQYNIYQGLNRIEGGKIEQPPFVPPQSVAGRRILDRAARNIRVMFPFPSSLKGDVETSCRSEKKRLDLNHLQDFGPE